MWKLQLVIFIVYLFIVNPIEGCSSSFKCRRYHYQRFTDLRKYITNFRGLRKLNNLALIGTHDSLTYNTIGHRTQELDLDDQLVKGIRVFQVGIHAKSNKFVIHKIQHYLNMLFETAIKRIIEFLKKNSEEFVIVLMHEEYSAKNESKTNCQILGDYLLANDCLVTKWSFNDTIDIHRGKILLGTIGDRTFSDCIKDLQSECRLSSESRRSIFGERQIEAKKRELRALQEASFYRDYKCFISFSSHDFMESKYKVAVTGTKQCDEPINHFMVRYFDNSHRGLIILIADFPTSELIQQVYNSNTVSTSQSKQKIT